MTGEKARWYVVHTYSGYENKVKANLESRAQSMGMGDYIFRVVVPEETEKEVKNGKEKEIVHKTFPGYVLVEMIMTDDSWYIVRNTRGVTGFVGPGSKPVPLTEDEIHNMGIVEKQVTVDVEVGEQVKVVSGPFEDFIVAITEISIEKHKIKGLVNMFGRETSVELDFNQIQKL